MMRLNVMLASTLQTSLLLVLLALSGQSRADTVRADGHGYPLPNVSGLREVNVKLTKTQIDQLAQKASEIKIPKAGFTPLTTTTLTICKNIQSRKVNIQHLARPMFVIGDNESSATWLAKYKPELEKVRAVGLIVEAKNVGALKRIRDESGNLELYPANGNALSKMFGINCYPVLISKHLIEH